MEVKIFLCLIKHHAMKAYGRMEEQLQTFFSLALHGGEWSASHPTHLTSVPFEEGTRWAPELALTLQRREKSLGTA
jgi:hypothetical protein